MSVEARELMSDEWTRWQGHVVNDVYPLGRCLGCSEHGAVFLSKSRTAGHADVAIKLFPASRVQEELQLPRWARAAGLSHAHLLPLLEAGACRLEGLPYLYVVMAYADQTLAQLLMQRALSGEEAREMLIPILNALAFLHGQDMVQGQLKPANVLVVGDQLKLASDTIRRAGEESLCVGEPSAYDPPEGPEGSGTAGDIWALGISLVEALTRRSPQRGAGNRNEALLPADLAPELREVVARCLSLRPQDRPKAAELLAWAMGRSALPVPVETPQPAALERQEPKAPAQPPRPSPAAFIPDAVRPVQSVKFPRRRTLIGAVLAATVILAVSWAAISSFRSHRTPEISDAGASATSPTPMPEAEEPAVQPQAAVRGRPGTEPAQPYALHEVIPTVSASAARTIRGHVKVSVRAIVNPNGSVSAVLADRSGPSRYFERLAVESAKKWTFPPAAASSSRIVQVQFEFGRDGTTAHAIPLP